MERLAATDTLTGLWNRRHFEKAASTDIARCQRYGQISSLVMLDVDHFKKVNDTLGHAAGDQVLIAVAQAVASAARASDTACRWGGEEFVVLTPSIGARSAKHLAERIREVLAGIDLPSPLGRVTISAGVAQLGPGEMLEAWVGRADAALYRAKSEGRDRVELSVLPSDAPEQRVVQLVWDADHECGDALLDQQHRDLYHLANSLLDEWMSGGPRAGLEQLMGTLIEHVVRHVAYEEQLLQRVGYTGLAGHKEQHRSLIAEALRVRDGLRTGVVQVNELLEFLVVTIVRDHLVLADAQFFPVVAAAGKR